MVSNDRPVLARLVVDNDSFVRFTFNRDGSLNNVAPSYLAIVEITFLDYAGAFQPRRLREQVQDVPQQDVRPSIVL